MVLFLFLWRFRSFKFRTQSTMMKTFRTLCVIHSCDQRLKTNLQQFSSLLVSKRDSCGKLVSIGIRVQVESE